MIAIRTVSETDDIHVIEGLGIPFGGPFPGNGDIFATRATPKTNFYWALFPDRAPSDLPEVAARFVRPMTYQHGMDPQVGLDRVGGWSPVRADDKGVWIQAQLDKHHAYYGALRELLDADALGLSSGSVEHSARIAQRTGDWIDWPVYEMALTPTSANPWAAISARSAEFAGIIARATAPAKPAVRWSPAADHAAMGAGILGSLLYLVGVESDEPDQVAMLQTAADSVTEWIAAERGEIGSAEGDEIAGAFMSAVRVGKRNSGTDLSQIDAIHDATVTLGATAHAGEKPANDESTTPPDDSEASRSAEALRETQRANGERMRDAIARAAQIGAQVGAATAAEAAKRIRS